jgi:hypothetical protein
MKTPAPFPFQPKSAMKKLGAKPTNYVRLSTNPTLWLQHIRGIFGDYWQCKIYNTYVNESGVIGTTPYHAVMNWREINDHRDTHFTIRFGFPTDKRIVASPETVWL